MTTTKKTCTISTAYSNAKRCEGRLLVDFLPSEQFAYIENHSDNGAVGRMIELYLTGQHSDSSLLDCVDGDIKTIKMENGRVARDSKLTTFSEGVFNEMDDGIAFTDSKLYQKTKKILFVGVERPNPSNPWTWKCSGVWLFDLTDPASAGILQRYEREWEYMSKVMRESAYGERRPPKGTIRYDKENICLDMGMPVIELRRASSRGVNELGLWSDRYERWITDVDFCFYMKNDAVQESLDIARQQDNAFPPAKAA